MAYGTVLADTLQTSTAGGVLGAGNASIMKNRIINGAMVISQYNGASAVTNANAYILDRMQSIYLGSGTARWTAQQSTDAPTGFNNSFQCTVTTADAAPSAGFGYSLNGQPIEGFNTADLGFGTASAKTVTLSFWVKSSLTGSFPVLLHNSAADRAYGTTYTITSANTWEQKSVTITGDTSGTWLTNNGIGIFVRFGGGGGSSRTISSGAWTATTSTPTNVTGATSVVGTNGATFYITGVQLEVGSSATGYEYRQYGQELALCQRYYQRYNAGPAYTVYGYGTGYNATIINAFKPLQTPMRATPTTLDIASVGSYKFDSGASSYTITAISLNTSYINANYLALDVTISSGGVAGQSYIFASLNNTSSYIGVGAEL